MTDFKSNGPDGSPVTPDSGQFDLFAQQRRWAPDSPAGKFEAFHADNPQVWDVLVHEARRWRAEGREKLGVALLVGRVRWVLSIRTNSTGDGFKINDHYAAYYARLLMLRCPDLRGLFELRKSLDADEWIADVADADQATA